MYFPGNGAALPSAATRGLKRSSSDIRLKCGLQMATIFHSSSTNSNTCLRLAATHVGRCSSSSSSSSIERQLGNHKPARALLHQRLLRQSKLTTVTVAAAAAAAGPGSSHNSGGSNSGSGGGGGSSGGVLGMLKQWNQDSRKLREQLQSLGLAGVVAYGLFNTAYYTVAFLLVWFTVGHVPQGQGLQVAARKAAEVFALVWAGSQVTKLLRAGGALAFAPVVDRGLTMAVERFKLKNKQQAFAVVVVACLALAAAVFGAVVALHA